ncbi:jerky protein homolog-like [Oscarella lobularis]|uniref:jerky protein homolog-like n=1 Tax=Oscarella lobularis TaxID=121494 RepID=UPI003313C606
MGIVRPTKVMKLGSNEKVDEAVFLWFKQARLSGAPVSGPLLCEKAMRLSQIIADSDTSRFSASSGWLKRFCKRFAIRGLTLNGEKLSSDSAAAADFASSFQKFIEDEGLSLHQVFNCDESALYFRLLPQKTLAGAFEKSASGWKKSKERVTILACSNASGSMKLPILVIGKTEKPRCFRGINTDSLPTLYCGKRNAWMTREIFGNWFNRCFVPSVKEALEQMGIEQKAVLIVDNCSAHPGVEELTSADGKIVTKFLPPNVTAILQPMDQGVLVQVKKKYQRKIFRNLLLQDEQEEGFLVRKFLSTINVKTVIELIAQAWDEVTPETLRKSWRKILFVPREDGPGDDTVHHDDLAADELVALLTGNSFNLGLPDIQEWLDSCVNEPGHEILTDEEICEKVKATVNPADDSEAEPDSEEETDLPCSVSHSRAMSMFDECLTWLQQQPEATSYTTAVLRDLRELEKNRHAQAD